MSWCDEDFEDLGLRVSDIVPCEEKGTGKRGCCRGVFSRNEENGGPKGSLISVPFLNFMTPPTLATERDVSFFLLSLRPEDHRTPGSFREGINERTPNGR